MTSPLRQLSRVDVYVSSVLSTSLDETWRQARDFSGAPYWAQAGRGEFTVRKMRGRASSEIGSGRLFKVGDGRLYEKLTALDDYKHNMRWILVSHPGTLSPFGEASFLNYSSKLGFRKVTDTGETFGEWKGQFYTEPEYAEEMEHLLSGWYHAGFDGLQVSAGGESRQAIPRVAMLDPDKSVPVAPPLHDQAAFHGPQHPAACDVLNDYASRKFLSREHAQVFVGAHTGSHLHKAHTGSTARTFPQEGCGQFQVQIGRKPASEQSTHSSSLSPPSPQTAPIQDTIYQGSNSSSATSAGSQSGLYTTQAAKPSPSYSAQPGNEAVPSHTQSKRGGQTQAMHHAVDYYPCLKSITEDSPDLHTDQRPSSIRTDCSYRSGPGPPDKGRMKSMDGLQTWTSNPHMDPQTSRVQLPRTRSSVDHVMGQPTVLSSNPSLDSNYRNSHRSSSGYRSGGSYKSGGPGHPVAAATPQDPHPQAYLPTYLNESSSWADGYRVSHEPQEQMWNSHGSRTSQVYVNQEGSRSWSRDKMHNDEDHDDGEQADRSSLDEQVLFLQQRHNLMHGNVLSNKACESPFANTIGSVQNPFLQASAVMT